MQQLWRGDNAYQLLATRLEAKLGTVEPIHEMRTALAPTGKLRASINLGNPILASRDATNGTVHGISVDLAHALAARLETPIEFLVVAKAAQSVDAVVSGSADVGFFAIDPARADKIAFTRPYVLIEGCYLVPEGSPLSSAREVDRPGAVVATSEGSAYDLFLSRELKIAKIERTKTPDGVVRLFIDRSLDAAAGIRQQLESEARQIGGLRLLPEPFMVIRQAMGLANSRGAGAAAFLDAFVEDARANGLVSEAIARHKIDGVSIADGG